jgi:phosphoribosylcarboxyaminoimidazole (NCAIR) mutase
MTYGIRAWDAAGVLTFDSTTDLTLFPKTEEILSGNSQVGNGAGITRSYPQFAGKKIMPFLTSPYGAYGSLDGYAVLSCRVSYPNGIPTVSIFVDRAQSSITGANQLICDGYLVVMLTGASQ